MSDRLLCSRSLLTLVRVFGSFRFPRFSAMDSSDGTRSASHSVSDGHGDFGSCRKQYIHSRPETYQTDQFSLFDDVADAFPEYDAAGHNSGNLCKDDVDFAVADHDHIPFVFDAGGIVVCGLEGSFPIVDRLDASGDRTAIDMYIEERQEDAQLRHATDSIDLHH